MMTLSEKRKEIYDYIRSLGIPLEHAEQKNLSELLHEYHKLAFEWAPKGQKIKLVPTEKKQDNTGNTSKVISKPVRPVQSGVRNVPRNTGRYADHPNNIRTWHADDGV